MHHGSLPCACATLRKASRAVSRLYDGAMERAGMTTPQFSLLNALADGAVPLSRLAERMVMDRTSLYRTFGPVERRGWVAISEGARGRTKQAALTPAGREAMEAAAPVWAEVQARVVERLGAERWDALADALGELTGIATARAQGEDAR